MVKPEPREFLAILSSQRNWPRTGERAGLLSYLDKFRLRVTVEAGQALAVLYRESRLYKGPRLAVPSQSATTRSTGNISVTATHVEQ